MGGRRRLRSGLERVFADHRSALAQELRREHRALIAGLSLDGDALLAREGQRVALLGVRARESSRIWAQVIEKRRAGRGRRPSPRALERAARRAALDDASYQAALDRLRELAGASRRPVSIAEAIAARKAGEA